MTLELTAWELRAGTYELMAHVAGDEELRATRPFDVTIRPGLLLD
ncbi:MAG: hypothetical protein L0H79_02180 [Intrasporangium sp.]|nr:hypothetical protein [Intrasporangium sp.]MDN5794542.1 hypothetical protein [Intrasporangium sp.]